MKNAITLGTAILHRRNAQAHASDYHEAHQDCKYAYIFDGWLGLDHEETDKPNPKPERPENYKELTQFWSCVDVEIAFKGYPSEKIIDMIGKGEFFYAPTIEQARKIILSMSV